MAESWTLAEPLDKPCIHRTPNAEGTVSGELHGVCIFCWRDRASSWRRYARELQSTIELALPGIEESELQLTDGRDAAEVIRMFIRIILPH